jgi:hypothetical protein
MLLWVVKGERLLEVCTCGRELSLPEQGVSYHIVGHRQVRRVLLLLGQGEALVCQLV